MTKSRFILISVVVSMAVYCVVTWPLAAEFHAGIPSSNRPEAGGARYMIPGDHLQFLYQLWMLADAFTGGTPLFYHVYEFNQGNDQALYNPGSYYFPFGFLYAAGYALGGRVVGWNLMLCLTVWLIYLSTWLLVRRFTRSALTAAVASLPSILLPYFYVSLLGGSPTGMGVLWVPLIFLGVDVAIRDQKLWGGVLAGFLLFICSWVDLHVFFFVFLATPVWALMCAMLSRPGLLARLRVTYLPVVWIFVGMIGAYLQTSLIKATLDDTLQSKGRTLNESLGYALQANGWFNLALDNRDNIIYVGVVAGLILLIGWVLLGWDWLRGTRAGEEGNLPLTPPGRGSKNGAPPWRGQGWVLRLGASGAPFWTFCMFLVVIAGIMVLALGPNTPFDPNHHLWKALRAVIPPYRMIRQPAKIFCLLTPFLGIALALALDRMNGVSRRRSWRVLLAGVVIAGFMVDYGRRLEPTICLLDYEQGGYRAVAVDAAKSGRENRALAIPLWPGDSHWNSITEYYATLHRTRMLNGYSPSVSRQYFTHVFLRFEAINMGLINDDILDGLLAMRIGYVILHEDAFPPKVSPFPVSQTLDELRRHPRLRFLAKDKAVWAFKILESGEPCKTGLRRGGPLLTGWQWDACDVAGGSATVVDEGTNIFMRLPAPDGRIQLDPRTVYPVEGLRYVASVRGEGVLSGSCGSGLSGDCFSVKVSTTGAWTWVELPVPELPAGRQTFVGPVFTNLSGCIDISMITLMGRDWQWLKPGEAMRIPAKAFCYTAYSDPDSEQVQLEVDRVQAGCAFYAPVVPVLPGRYLVTLEYDSEAPAGTGLGVWTVLRSDGKERVAREVVVGSAVTVEYRLERPRPLRFEFDYNRAAGMGIRAVKVERVD